MEKERVIGVVLAVGQDKQNKASFPAQGYTKTPNPRPTKLHIQPLHPQTQQRFHTQEGISNPATAHMCSKAQN